jgi:phosphate transport system substrate-binding protein
MNGVKGRAGKCSNFGNCSLADSRTNQEILAGMDFVCGECGKPLLLVGASEPVRNKTGMMVAVLALVVLLLAGGAIAWSLSKSKANVPAVEAPAPRQDAVVPPPPAPVATPVPRPPESGTCSDADAKVGLCRKKE